MNKILAVAKSEYIIAATSKAFIVGIILMPVFMGGAMVVQYLTRDQVDLSPRKVAVADPTGRLFEFLQQRSEWRNENGVYTQDEEDDEKRQTQAKFFLERAESGDEETKADLSQRVRDGELFAFVLLDEEVFEPSSNAAIRYHSQTPSYRTLPNWIERTVNEAVKRERTASLGLSEQDVAMLSKSAPLRTFGLLKRDAEGNVIDAREENRILTFAIPFGGIMLMFMMVMSVTPSMLNNVLEEKMQKISEFLVSSVTPFELMLGKLLGAVGIGLTLSTIYLGAAYSLANYFEIADRVPTTLYVWFVFFVFIALVMYGSIFSAIGAACSEIRDAQSLMTPVMILVVLPMMCIGPVLDSPASPLSKALSLFPPATPMLMFARIAIPPGPAVWEVILAVVLTTLFAILCVWAAGKVFRIGILSQGQAPTLPKLMKWIFTE